jgi:glycosyltransferase involved in cell wall biosynthesis
MTILIPLYNMEKWIGRSIQTAMEQTVNPLDILIVDDCLNDSSSTIVRRYSAIDCRIRLVRLARNSGMHVARMFGVQQALGTWILSLDADHMLTDDVASIVLQEAQSRDTDIVMSQLLSLVNDETHVTQILLPQNEVTNQAELATEFHAGRLNYWIWAKLIRTSVYREALLLLNETTKNARFTATGLLHCGLLYLKARSMVFLSELYGYIYVIDTPVNLSRHVIEQQRNEAAIQHREVLAILNDLYHKAGVSQDAIFGL